MANAHANLPPRRFRNHFYGPWKFRSDGQHANVSPGSLPQALKKCDGRQCQVLRSMHTTPRMAEKRPFEMDAERPRLRCVVAVTAVCGGLDHIGNALQGGASGIERRCDGSREVASHAMLREKSA